MNRLFGDFSKGIYRENPITRMLLGLCPVLAVTTAAMNGLAMGLATTFVLFMAATLVSILKNVIPRKVRIPAYIVIIASFVTITDLVMAAYAPELHDALGIFIPLIVVNCLIMGRAEGFASRNPLANSMADALGMGLGFTLGLTALGSMREILGAGTWFDMPIMGTAFDPALLFILPPGAFLGMGIMVALLNWLDERAARKRGHKPSEEGMVAHHHAG